MEKNIKIFEYNTPLDLLQRLNRQFELWSTDSLDSDKALDFCLTAWSLADWDFYFNNPDLVGKEEREVSWPKHKYRVDLFQLCDDLKIMAVIANGTKHFSLSRPKSDISVSLVTNLGFSSGFAWGNGIKIDIDGNQHNLARIIMNVHQFWNDYLDKK